MEEAKVEEKTYEQVKAEADSLFSQAGMLQYDIEVKKAQLMQMNQHLLVLNNKAGELQKAQAKPELKVAQQPA